MREIDADLLRYFAIRDEQQQEEIGQALPQLEERMRAFLHERRDDPDLPAILARMIREMAVISGSRGRFLAGGRIEDAPKDSFVLWDALHYVREYDDVCPAWRIFDRRDSESRADDA